MRLIDADMLKEILHSKRIEFVKHPTFVRSDMEEGIDRGIGYALLAINDAPTIQPDAPRVMTLEEVKSERICWIEDTDDGMIVRLFPATMFGTGEYANGSKSYIFLAQKPWAIDVNDCEWWYLIEDYGETWRCWTARPTDEQREAVKWE